MFSCVEVAYASVHMGDFDFGLTEKNFHEQFVGIHYCKEGRIEQEINNEFFYLMPGDCSVLVQDKEEKTFKLPLKHYHGISIGIDLKVTENPLIKFLRECGTSPLEAAKSVCGEESYIVLRSSESLKYFFAELYKVDTNCDSITLFVNGAEYETQDAVDHAVVFENVKLKDGENTITAKAGDLEDTILLNGVKEHNLDYTLPDIAAAMQVGNWFDDIADTGESEEIEIIEGYYSIEDTFIDLMSNEECIKIMKGWLMQQGALSMVSTLEATRDMMGTMSFHGLSAFMDPLPQCKWAQANRLLNKIKK